MKSLLVFSLMAVGLVGSWPAQAADSIDVRPEALVTGAILLMLATVLRHAAGGERMK